jgi:hypothetical protein
MIHRAVMLGGAFFCIAVLTTFSRWVIQSLWALEHATVAVTSVLFVAALGMFAGVVTRRQE